MEQPIITDQDVEKGIEEAEVVLKILRLLKKVKPQKRYAVLESARLMVEAAAEPEITRGY